MCRAASCGVLGHRGWRACCVSVCVGGWACDRHARKYVRSCPAEACRIACVAMACVQVRLAAYCARCFGVCTLVRGGVCVVGGGVRTADTRAGVPWAGRVSIWRELCVVRSTDYYTQGCRTRMTQCRIFKPPRGWQNAFFAARGGARKFLAFCTLLGRIWAILNVQQR